MGRYRSRSRSYSPRRSKRYDDPRDSRTRRGRRSPAPSGLLVRNISLSARPEDLRVPFERFGPIKDVYLPKNYYTGEPRGFGFVKFRHPEDAAEAKDHLNHTVIGGREIRIVYAEENRKTPNEMRRISRASGSSKRRSPLRSPRRRYRSFSRSPSPARSDLRERRERDDRYSPRRSRPVSSSISPRDDRDYHLNEMHSRHSRSISRSRSASDQENYRLHYRSATPRRDSRRSHGEIYDEPSRSPGARGKVHSPSMPHGSPSPRRNGWRSVDERSPSIEGKEGGSSRSRRSPGPRRDGRIFHDERYDGKSPGARGKGRGPSRSRSRSYSPS